MAFIDWKEELSVTFEEVDGDHKKLVGMINEIHVVLDQDPDPEMLEELLEELLSYTSWHFRHEERLMQNSEYPGLMDHKKEHEDLAKKATELYEKFINGDTGVLATLLPFLKDWLTHHITKTDKQMGQFLAKQES